MRITNNISTVCDTQYKPKLPGIHISNEMFPESQLLYKNGTSTDFRLNCYRIIKNYIGSFYPSDH